MDLSQIPEPGRALWAKVVTSARACGESQTSAEAIALKGLANAGFIVGTSKAHPGVALWSEPTERAKAEPTRLERLKDAFNALPIEDRFGVLYDAERLANPKEHPGEIAKRLGREHPELWRARR